jgi:hypothetical protein
MNATTIDPAPPLAGSAGSGAFARLTAASRWDHLLSRMRHTGGHLMHQTITGMLELAVIVDR